MVVVVCVEYCVDFVGFCVMVVCVECLFIVVVGVVCIGWCGE